MISEQKRIFVTGGAGFIGSAFTITAIEKGYQVVNLDKLTYSGNLDNLSSISKSPNYQFVHGDIGDADLVLKILQEFRPNFLVNFAAETHVDRSIRHPQDFIKTNVEATERLLWATKEWWDSLRGLKKTDFRFHHISTDEVFGSLTEEDPPFTESSHLRPNSPYSASKASSDLIVRAYFHTYGLPVTISNCSNNYGPRQYPEKLIPFMILRASEGKELPVYGNGLNVRDWLHVDDHCDAIMTILEKGVIGETYNIGGTCEVNNITVVKMICKILNEVNPKVRGGSYSDQIVFVTDRPGHDFRYAIDISKITNELGWKPSINFEDGLRDTVQWYLNNVEWRERLNQRSLADWISSNYESSIL